MKNAKHFLLMRRRIKPLTFVILIATISFTLLQLFLLSTNALASTAVPRDACSSSGGCTAPTPTPLPANCTGNAQGQVACTFPASNPTPTPAVYQQIQYVVCPGGNDPSASFSRDGSWNQVQPTEVVSAPDYSGSVLSWQGTEGLVDPGNSSKCPGVYYWGWNQYYHKATWQAHLPIPNNMSCTASVYIPHWYSGAPDANYTFSVTPDGGSEQTLQKIQWDQNQTNQGWQNAKGWFPPFSSFTLPPSSDGSYTLTLTLTNGTTPWWYLGADAAQFSCLTKG